MGYNKAKVQKQREEVETNLYEEDEIYAILNRKENIGLRSNSKIYLLAEASLRKSVLQLRHLLLENMGLDALVLKMKNNIQYLSILKNWIDMVKDKYNFILIDCPPSNNLVTRSAFLLSDYYIIPTVLDGLSTNV